MTYELFSNYRCADWFIRDNNIDKLYFAGLDIDDCVLKSDLVESSVNKML